MNPQYSLLPSRRLQPPRRSRLLTRLLLWAGIAFLNATALVAQIPGQALNFDGVDDYVNLGTDLGNFGTGDFTIEIKLQTTFSSATSSFPDSPLLMKRTDCGSGNLFGLKLNPTGTLTWVMNEANGVNFVGGNTTGIACNDGAWHQVAVVRSGSSLKVYIDGTESLSLTGTVNINNSSPFLIGLDGLSCNSNRFPGSIDELRIWNVARTATQIAENRDCELKGNETGLVAYYNCNQGTAAGTNTGLSTLTNAVSGGPAGTLNNFARTGATSNWVAPGGAGKCVNCNTFVTRTTANGLGSNVVNDVFAVGNTVYAATDAGLRISTDGGQTFTNQSASLTAMIEKVFVQGNTVYAVKKSQAGLFLVKDNGLTITNPLTAYVSNVFAIGNTIYVSRSGTVNGFGISTNDGGSFSTFLIAPVGQKLAGKCVYVIGSKIYVGSTLGTAQGLYVSTNNGTSFSKIGTTSGDGRAVYGFGNTVYFASSAGLFTSTDAGVTFTKRTTANGLGSNAVNDVYAVGSTVYAATDNGLSISNDGGQTFTNYTTANGLAAAKINAVYAVGSTVYAATSAGLSISGFRTQVIVPGGQPTVASEVTAAPGTSLTLRAANTNTGYSWSPGGATTKDITVTTSGTYSVTATGDCSGTGSIAVTYLTAQPTNAVQVTTSPSGVSKVTISIPVSASGIPIARLAAAEGSQAATAAAPIVKVKGPSGFLVNTKAKLPLPKPGGRLGADATYSVTIPSIKKPGTYTVSTYDTKTKKLLSVQTFTK